MCIVQQYAKLVRMYCEIASPKSCQNKIACHGDVIAAKLVRMYCATSLARRNC